MLTYRKLSKMILKLTFLNLALKLVLGTEITITNFKFIGYRNVWHDGSDHTVMKNLFDSNFAMLLVLGFRQILKLEILT